MNPYRHHLIRDFPDFAKEMFKLELNSASFRIAVVCYGELCQRALRVEQQLEMPSMTFIAKQQARREELKAEITMMLQRPNRLDAYQ